MGGRGGGSSIASKAATPSAAPPAPAAPAAPKSLENQILDAYDFAETHYLDSSWVTLAGLRDALPNVPGDVLEAELKRLDRERKIELTRDADQKNITKRENAAGFMFGGKRVTMFKPWGPLARRGSDRKPNNPDRLVLPGDKGFSSGRFGTAS